jgi:hypothetical protein
LVKNYGSSQEFVISPGLGYRISNIVVDGVVVEITAEEDKAKYMYYKTLKRSIL